MWDLHFGPPTVEHERRGCYCALRLRDCRVVLRPETLAVFWPADGGVPDTGMTLPLALLRGFDFVTEPTAEGLRLRMRASTPARSGAVVVGCGVWLAVDEDAIDAVGLMRQLVAARLRDRYGRHLDEPCVQPSTPSEDFGEEEPASPAGTGPLGADPNRGAQARRRSTVGTPEPADIAPAPRTTRTGEMACPDRLSDEPRALRLSVRQVPDHDDWLSFGLLPGTAGLLDGACAVTPDVGGGARHRGPFVTERSEGAIKQSTVRSRQD